MILITYNIITQTTSFKIVADDILFPTFFEKIRLEISCGSSAKAEDSHEISNLIFLRNTQNIF